jgi:predicted HicB family RNase H-like nuclease
MPKQPKKRKPGRPRLPKDEAKGKIVPVRFATEELERVYRAAEKAEQSVSQWIRSTLSAATSEESI